MKRRYVTADVFTDRMFGGNPVAVVLDAAGLSVEQMQAVAVEFGYSETTFVLPPRDPSHTAWVRIFTPSREVPFAGHPNVGTAFVLAQEMTARGDVVPDRLVFEEAAGLVPVDLLRQDGAVVGAELTAPEPLSRRAQVAPDQVAACLSLTAGDVRTDAHPPQVVSVGLPFLVAELASRDALRRAKPDRAAYNDLFPLDGAVAVYAYTRDVDTTAPEVGTDLQARMFTPRMTEDPATGSATAAATALLADVRGGDDLSLRVGQGVDMGRPSLMSARAGVREGAVTAFVGGRCIAVMEGSFALADDVPTKKPLRSEANVKRRSLRWTALGGGAFAAVVLAAANWLMPGREILTVGAVITAAAMFVAVLKLFVSAVPNRRTEHLKVLAEAGALSVAALAFAFFLSREVDASAGRAEAARISATSSWLSTQDVRELVARLCDLERQAGIIPEARANSRLLCLPP